MRISFLICHFLLGSFDMQDWMRWQMEQELMKKEQENARQMLEALEKAQVRVHLVR